MKLLRIDSSVRVEQSITRMLTDFFILALKKHRAIDLVRRDVGLEPMAMPSNDFITANYTQATDRTSTMKSILQASDTVISELVAAQAIVVASPMYNFSISTNLKAYIDNIVRVGETFSVEQDGNMKGLLLNRKLLVVTSRGAMSYKAGEALHNMDYQENYLTTVFSFLGFTDISFVHTEAQDFGSEQMQTDNLLRSKQALLELAASW